MEEISKAIDTIGGKPAKMNHKGKMSEYSGIEKCEIKWKKIKVLKLLEPSQERKTKEIK